MNTTTTIEDQYVAEAKERWGNTEAFRQSQERTQQWTKDDVARIKEQGAALMQKFVAAMTSGAEPTSDVVQTLVEEHRQYLHQFYDCSHEMHLQLAQLYENDERFAAYFAAFHPDLPAFIIKAIRAV